MTNAWGVSPTRYSGIPLGGLGAGSVEIRADGRFHEWQIMNNVPLGNAPADVAMDHDGLFFGLVTADGGKSRVLMLAEPHWYDYGPDLSWETLNWTTDPYHMPWTEYPSRIDYQGRFPFATLSYVTPGFPVAVKMEAFSPFIPLDAKNSGLPVAFMTFTLSNRASSPRKVALFGALKNCAGYQEHKNDSVIKFAKHGRFSRLEFSRAGVEPDSESYGTLAFGLWSVKAGRTSFVLHAAHPRDIYDPLMASGNLEDLDRSAFRGSIGNDLGTGRRVRKADVGLSRGVLARSLTLQPRETVEVTFALAWHFPNMAEPACDDKREIIGHQYANWFSSASEAFDYASANSTGLRFRSLEFMNAFYETSRDKWLLDAVAAQLTTLVKSSWWDRTGRFAVWEGLGCCGLQTLDITLYGSFPIVQFFPELQKSQMQLPTVTAATTGRPPHLFHGTISGCCTYPNNRIDNSIQFILLVWRDLLWTGDVEYARRLWPALEAFLNDAQSTDTDGDGLPNNAGVDQSYDQFPLFGTSAYVGLQYIGALKAASHIAGALGFSDRAADLAARAAKAAAALDSQLWNGDYYNLSFDSAANKGNAGCMADQLCGDWFVRQTDGLGLVDLEKARRAMKAVFKYCRRDGYLANCDWPRGGRVRIRRETSDQANCPWTGVEFAVAAEMILLGLEKEGLAIARDVWDRYERFGMRYNHIECGGHYYRAVSSWAVYLALYGFAWDARAARLTLRVPKARSAYVWCTPSAWGRVTFKAGARRLVELTAVQGVLALRRVTLAGVAASDCSVKIGGKKVDALLETGPAGTDVILRRQVTLKPGVGLLIST